jgi:hypothetical protein
VTDEGLLWENLYGRCLHESIKDSQPDLLGYFNYLYNVRNTCFKNSFLGFTNNDTVTKDHIIDCAKNQVYSVSQSVDAVDRCVQDSFKTPGVNTTDNMLFYQDKLLAEVYGISVHPAITINGQLYKGDMTGYDIFRAVCASFSTNFKPVKCLEEYMPQLQKELLQHNAVQDFATPSNGRWHIVLTLIGVCAFNGLLIWLYKRWQT